MTDAAGGETESADAAGADSPWARPAEAVLEDLDSTERGLSEEEARRRRETHGPNELPRPETRSALRTFLDQFTSPLVVLLLAAAVLSLAVGLAGEGGDVVDAALIALILLLNGVFGFVQEHRAEQALEALQEHAAPTATVFRDGSVASVPARELVPGDVVRVEAGDAVPADARLLAGSSLAADEAALTGESVPAEKSPGTVPATAPLAERAPMLHAGTTVVRGRGEAVVTATGADTEMGVVAAEVATGEAPATPFQEEVARLGRRLGALVVALVVLVAAVQFAFTGTDPVSVVLVAITLAVAAVPEGLPAVVTLTLALGSRRLLERNALVRTLSVVESLGSVNTIVTDKTGTLTEDRMVVRRVATAGAAYEVTGGATPDDESEFRRDGAAGDGEAVAPLDDAALEALLYAGAACNNAALPAEGEPHGDPTEVALLVAARKAGVDPPDGRRREVPFSSERKRMTVVVGDGDPTAYVKGAPAVVLERCDRVLCDGDAVELTAERRAAVGERVDEFADDALRVIGLARRRGVDPDADPEDLESGLTFLGLQGMVDPPRPEVEGAISDCRRAGVRVVMATGDNPRTARSIARELGFDADPVVTGPEVEAMAESELTEAVAETDVFARVEPTHKVRILRALQERGERVAMTGDGINDAPALRNADVGVAMGRRGTDVARQAADLVLQDDNFVTIRDAIEEGRAVFDNIQKFVTYLLSANAGEVLVVLFGVLLATALFAGEFGAEVVVLTPVMLLWINLVTDGLPALALGVDPGAEGIMDRPPRGADAPILDRDVAVSVGLTGLLLGGVGLGVFFRSLGRGPVVSAQTTLFTFLVAVELVRIHVIRARYGQRLAANPWLHAAIAGSFGLQALVLYTPVADAFGVVPLGVAELARVGAGFAVFVVANVALALVRGDARDAR